MAASWPWVSGPSPPRAAPGHGQEGWLDGPPLSWPVFLDSSPSRCAQCRWPTYRLSHGASWLAGQPVVEQIGRKGCRSGGPGAVMAGRGSRVGRSGAVDRERASRPCRPPSAGRVPHEWPDPVELFQRRHAHERAGPGLPRPGAQPF